LTPDNYPHTSTVRTITHTANPVAPYLTPNNYQKSTVTHPTNPVAPYLTPKIFTAIPTPSWKCLT